MVNESIVQRIELLKNAKPRNLILFGAERETMYQSALEMASAWLKTEVTDLTYHPDFLLVESEHGVIKAELAEKIKRHASFIPQQEKAVCIVRDADCMTVELQNKLLKVLEDGEKTLSVIFITSKELIDTVTSRCMRLEFKKIPLAQMAMEPEFKSMALLLACDGSKELYKKIEGDTSFCQYLEGFLSSLCSIKDRKKLKNILRLTHSLKENDKEYLPASLEGWQMRAYLNMIKMLYWHILIKKMGFSIPTYLHFGALSNLYEVHEAEIIYRRAEDAISRSEKNGAFSKNDFFELMMYMVPVG